jgi:hypothetical protein
MQLRYRSPSSTSFWRFVNRTVRRVGKETNYVQEDIHRENYKEAPIKAVDLSGLAWFSSVLWTRGLVKVSGKINGHPFRSSFMARGNGSHMLPVMAAIRQAIGNEAGETVKVLLEERIG